ncbi:hypothetical protein BC936DRAFT_146350 [Jimgerdemannia flammicorona]|uniref:Uncharacterized protein n=1 Tax=Jimgerdemannia flammicorona TaxID=994334 RepID=A0A433DLG2_9FUNG|nr:hypothetical protein BC936DRAFT_146350 [Jimgerdemannia flammicorona]
MFIGNSIAQPIRPRHLLLSPALFIPTSAFQPLIPPLIKPIQERDGFRRSLVLGEIAHDVSGLLPQVHCFLVFDLALEDQDVRHRNVLDIAVTLKLLADLGADGADGEVKLVESDNFGSL